MFPKKRKIGLKKRKTCAPGLDMSLRFPLFCSGDRDVHRGDFQTLIRKRRRSSDLKQHHAGKQDTALAFLNARAAQF